ncbi:MAG: hypothetical protein IT367_05560, partial [Candidatus Hydrogenedentes bacterium]|nr:hypothetical protein [Candidatus Hydrogenedentota bacterium]
MGSLRLIARSLAHYRRAHFGLIVGTALAAAILTGALAVGDSVNYTLRTFALQRIGNTEYAVVSAEKLFSTSLGAALHEKSAAPVAPALVLRGMAIFQNNETGSRAQVNNVQAVGVDAEFWNLAGSQIELGRREVALNEHLANLLDAKIGDTVALRIPKPGLLSRDAPLSSREEESSARANFTVKAIAADNQFGRFSLAASQLPPANFFVNIADLQQLADIGEKGNLLLIGGAAPLAQMEDALAQAWDPKLAGMSATKRDGEITQL